MEMERAGKTLKSSDTSLNFWHIFSVSPKKKKQLQFQPSTSEGKIFVQSFVGDEWESPQK